MRSLTLWSCFVLVLLGANCMIYDVATANEAVELLRDLKADVIDHVLVGYIEPYYHNVTSVSRPSSPHSAFVKNKPLRLSGFLTWNTQIDDLLERETQRAQWEVKSMF